MGINLTTYNKFREVPEEAKKTIKGGKLNGFTDINPMWRIKMLTDEYGECGFGWYYDEVERWTESMGNERVCFVKILLFIKRNDTWSAPIVGIGGSKVISSTKNGLDLSDEAYKMALTDAISVSCKALGMGADVYFSKDRTKYDADNMDYFQPTPGYKPVEDNVYWAIVAKYIQGIPAKSGKDYKTAWIEMTGAGKAEIAVFDAHVSDYKKAYNL